MLIATFGPNTAWVGKTITFENERFMLEDHGPIAPADVMEYDRHGHLHWANDGARAWVGARAQAASVARPTLSAAEEVRDLLLPAGDVIEVVGESHYQADLEAIVGGKAEQACEVEKWAYLIPEPDNPYDRHAVAIYIEGRKVGYLGRELAQDYAVPLVQLWDDLHARGVCRALIGGGWRRIVNQLGGTSYTDEGHFGVKLALATPENFVGEHTLRVLSPEELAAGPPAL